MIEVKPGCHVYGRRGGYIGTVEAADTSLLRIRGPLPERERYYIPTELVVGALPGGGEIFLDCLTDDVHTHGWLHPPHGVPEKIAEDDRPIVSILAAHRSTRSTH